MTARRLRHTISFLLVAFFIVGCTDDRRAAEDASNKTLRLSFTEDVKTSDPALASDTLSAELIGNIYEGLLRFSYLGPAGQIEPALAKSLPVIRDKDQTLVFHLRTGILFHNDGCFPNSRGREVNAQDFVYSLKRLGDPRLSSPNWWMLDGMIKGLNEWREKLSTAKGDDSDRIFNEEVEGLKATGSHILQFKLTKPYPQFLQILSMTHASVVPRECVEKYKEEFSYRPVGTGPFQIVDWKRGSKIIAKKNPTFHEDFYPSVGDDEERKEGLLQAAGSPLPFVQEIQWDILKEEQPRWLKFLSGGLDVSLIPKDNFSDVINASGELKNDYKEKGFRLRKDLSLTTWWIEFNNKDALLGKNKKLRMAIAHAFDRGTALRLLHNDRGILASGPVTPTLEGGDQVNPYPYDFNLEKARKLLAEAGYPEGKGLPPLRYEMRGPNTLQRHLAEFFQKNLKEIGIQLEVNANSFPEALTKAKEGRFQIMLGGWAADYPDPENFFQNFYSKNQAPGPNTAAFVDAEYDRLYERIRTQKPGPDRMQAFQRMNQILQEDIPVIFFFHSMTYTMYRSWVLNFKQTEFLYGQGRYLDLDPSLRKKHLKAR